MEPKTGKRIVSKGAYMRVQATGFGLACLTVVCGFIAFEYGGSLVLAAGDFVLSFGNKPNWSYGLYTLESLVLMLCFWKGSKYSYKKYTNIDPGLPLTRANTADLPASDSLVRASSRPLQIQETVLLRAVAEGQNMPHDQLVRASAGRE